MLKKPGVMRVALDARNLNVDQLRGIGRYVREIVTRIDCMHPVRWEFLSDRLDLPFHRPDVHSSNVQIFEQRGHRFHAWEQVALPRRLRQIRPDVVHAPGIRVPRWQPCPTVVTLHDVIPWLGDECGWPRGWYTDIVIPRALRRCAAVITISRHSQRDILRLWPSLEPKLHVIPLGVSDQFFTVRREIGDTIYRYGLHAPYFLYVGGGIPRKRLDWALEVFAQLPDDDAMLAVCGVGPEAAQPHLDAVTPDVRRRVRILPYVGDDELPVLYRQAIAVLYPTLYEGFGLPAVEAQAVGTPVLFSEVGSLTELKGPCAITLPVNDRDAWVGICSSLLARRREGLTAHEGARLWARQFSWDLSARRHLTVYQSIAKRNHLQPTSTQCARMKARA